MLPPIHNADSFNLSHLQKVDSFANNAKVTVSIDETESRSSRMLSDIVSQESHNAKVDNKLKSESLPIGEFFKDKRKPFYSVPSEDVMKVLYQK